MHDDLGYLGRYQRGTELPVTLRCETAGVPGWPSDPPVLSVYTAGASPALVVSKAMAADLQDVDGEEGTFRLGLYLGQLFTATGPHAVVVRYRDGAGDWRLAVGHFYLLPGGSADGAVIALHPVERPNARYLVQQLDSGRLARGRNPR